MILFINTSQKDSQISAISKKGEAIISNKWCGRMNQSEELLIRVDKLLREAKYSKDNIRGIAVFRGPGSYTGLRVGVATANALSYSLQIPVYGLTDGNLSKGWKKVINSFDKDKKVTPIQPIYSRPPKITKPKNRH